MAKKIKNVITHKWSFKTPMILRAQFLMSWPTFEPSIWASSHHQYYYFEILGFYCEQKHCTDDKRFLRYTYYVKKSFTDWSQGGEQITPAKTKTSPHTNFLNQNSNSCKRESRFVVKFLTFLTIWNHAEFNHNWDWC
jgi:hypothetical protein